MRKHEEPEWVPPHTVIQGRGPLVVEETHLQCDLPVLTGLREGSYTECRTCFALFRFEHVNGFWVWRKLHPIWNPRKWNEGKTALGYTEY